MIHEQDLKIVAQQLRKEFIRVKAQTLNKSPGQISLRADQDTYRNWEKAARVCLEEGASAADFIKAAFASCSNPMGPHCNMLSGEGARSWYRNYKVLMALDDTERGFKDAASSEFESSMMTCLTSLRSLTGSLDIGEHALMLLRREYTGYPAYVRVILAPHDEEVLDIWGAEALKQLIQDPGLVDAASDKGINIDKIMNILRNPQEISFNG